FFSSRRRHTRSKRDWSSDVCSSDLALGGRVRHLAADLIFSKRSFSEQRDGNEEVVFIVPDEVNDPQMIFTFTLTQATPKLLGKNDAGLRGAEHHYLVDRPNINTFIKNIDGEEVVQLPLL